MRFLIALCLLAASSAPAAADPKLGVLMVVDQMRHDYPARSPHHGFARFLEGAYYDNARHGHVPTYTAVGHAALSTGRHPKDHGIFANDFYDAKTKKTVYCVEDEKRGKGPFRLTVPTLGDRLKSARPGAKVVSISAKDRSAILMGGDKADAAVWYDKKTGRFVSSPHYGPLPSWLVEFNEENEVPADTRKSVTGTPVIDQLTLALARRAVEAFDLGEDEIPDLLLVSLSATDYIGHDVGPYDPRMDDQLKRVDRDLGAFLDYLDFKIGTGAYTAGLSSDHGVLPVPESEQGRAMGARRVSGKELRRFLEAGLRAEFGDPASGGDWILSWDPPLVHLDASGGGKVPRKAAELLAAREETVWAYPAGSISKRAEYAEVYERSLPAERSGIVVFLNKTGILLTDYPKGTSHGTPYDYDARVPLALIGHGVKPGRYDREALTIELAPSLGRLLGAPFDGPVLKEALRD